MREMPETEADFIEPEENLTVEDILAEANKVKYHALLEIWREVIRPAEAERFKKITPQWANRICTTYREINFADMVTFKHHYFDHILELAAILEVEIASDDECLNVLNEEEDREHNAGHYLTVIVNWQKAFLQWELDWDCEAEHAAIELAAISETHKMFFDQTGLINLLDQIDFQITDEDREMLAQALRDLQVAAQEER